MPSSSACHAAVALGYRGKQIDKAAEIIDREFTAAYPVQDHSPGLQGDSGIRQSNPEGDPGQDRQPQEPAELQFSYPRVDVDLPDIDARERYDVDEARAVVAGDWGAD